METTEGPVDLKQLTIEELLKFLPTTKIVKPRGKDVKITRSVFERAVLDELWDRHYEHLHVVLSAKILDPESTLCPPQEPDRNIFLDEVIKQTLDAFLRLTVKGELTEKGEYLNFGGYLYRVAMNEALDLRKQLIGVRPPSKKEKTPLEAGAAAEGRNEKKPKGIPKPVPEALDDVSENLAVTAASKLDLTLISGVRRILEEYRDESPERATSLRLCIQKEVEGWTWVELAERLPVARSIEARVRDLRKFEAEDKTALLQRLEGYEECLK